MATTANYLTPVADVRFAHEDAVADKHVAALDERHHPRRDGFIIIVSPACRASHPGAVADLGSAAAPLPLLGASAPVVRSACHRITGPGRRYGAAPLGSRPVAG